jgi:hypothetical protein
MGQVQTHDAVMGLQQGCAHRTSSGTQPPWPRGLFRNQGPEIITLLLNQKHLGYTNLSPAGGDCKGLALVLWSLPQSHQSNRHVLTLTAPRAPSHLCTLQSLLVSPTVSAH